MIIIHVDQKEIKKGNDAIVVRYPDDFSQWMRDVRMVCNECGHTVGHIIQRDKQDEYGASVVVELEDDE